MIGLKNCIEFQLIQTSCNHHWTITLVFERKHEDLSYENHTTDKSHSSTEHGKCSRAVITPRFKEKLSIKIHLT
jgi:hypothetical protein